MESPRIRLLCWSLLAPLTAPAAIACARFTVRFVAFVAFVSHKFWGRYGARGRAFPGGWAHLMFECEAPPRHPVPPRRPITFALPGIQATRAVMSSSRSVEQQGEGALRSPL